MGAGQHDETPGLAVEVAKLRLRVAAEKAEPARLLRQRVGDAPLGSAATAVVAGLLLGRTARGASGSRGGGGEMQHVAASLGSRAASVLGPTVASLLSTLVAGAAAEWRKR